MFSIFLIEHCLHRISNAHGLKKIRIMTSAHHQSFLKTISLTIKLILSTQIMSVIAISDLQQFCATIKMMPESRL